MLLLFLVYINSKMFKTLSSILLLCLAQVCLAQNTFTAFIKDADSKEPLIGATAVLTGTSKGATADNKGMVSISGIPNGRHVITCTFLGYQEKVDTFSFPLTRDTITIYLEHAGEKIEEVVISSTRSNRSIRDIPTRVEFIAGEELEEKGNMKPGDIRMMLNESTGIQTQQISATSANSSIRIQGLDGRYTQILKDGFPLYAGFSGGLGLLQTPPLDLKQVEVIKGSASTLYGGGAIAGLVNLISKVPTTERELRFLINGTSAGGLDLNGFYGQRFNKVGLTVFASRSSNKPYDPSSTGFTAIPKFERYVFNPKLFVYFSPKTRMNLGVNFTTEDRTGGDLLYIKGRGDSTHSYYEKNKSNRFSTQFSFDHEFSEGNSLTVKNSVNSFKRTISIPGYVFDGQQWSSYTEATYSRQRENMDWIAGINVYTDNFKEQQTDTLPKRNYDQNTLGAFVQNTWKANNWLQLETGLRGDYVIDYGLVLLPRISALFKISPKLSSRVGGGLGYKTPTIFTEETERIQYKSVLPISSDINKLERSYGANFDLNYKTSLFNDKVSFSINQLFFYTRINHPLLLKNAPGNLYQLENVDGFIDTKGWETNVKFGYGDFKLFIGYTFTDARLNDNGIIRENPLTARHRLNNVLMYEKEEKWKVGLEAYYYSKQTLTDGSTGKPYWICGFMAEKLWEKFSLFVNFENYLDTRQTRFDSIYTGTVTHPVFRDIYAPLDGFVVNGGLKLKL
ncbi:iron complex outermembrane receptor protein [Chitinophaga dinghuensis]|uniref:Iron complex outermembrane receptor protein n=1 Tax=Chitinophaga dinghuensis TaxID=1539050 RepID=A0A327VYS1_9BACT|nr:TonB-dependent receptor [Chitinophaga dinghuensis]RAJ80096.1 iron complex outermembrane receptor protein [Chitinophaga dinghuensis]